MLGMLFRNTTCSKTLVSKHYCKLSIHHPPVKKSVYISNSDDIYTNLALEDLLYEKSTFTSHYILLLWKNTQCTVIGRHQNPWLETDIDNTGIKLARRNSGGGTVYHDCGNLNITFFMPRKQYNRRENLSVIVRAIQNEWNIQTVINEREDIVYDNKYKISGTASKSGSSNAYHHCTVLVDTNKDLMSRSLYKIGNKGIYTNATQSTPSKVINLSEINPTVTIDRLITAIGKEYMRTCPITEKVMGDDYVSQHNGFSFITPDEESFPGLEERKKQFGSWDWIYGRTPKFEVRKTINISYLRSIKIDMMILVERGKVTSINLDFPASLLPFINSKIIHDSVLEYRGAKYSENVTSDIKKRIKFHIDCILQDNRVLDAL